MELRNTSITSVVPTEHDFAQYVRIIGKGKKGSRSLSFEEAKASMQMILNGSVEDVQLGAFLMLLRKKEETPEEIAGFVAAARQNITLPPTTIDVDLDWSSYAGKRKHLPWFLFAALLLSQRDIRVFMHGSAGHTEGRIYTENVCQALSLPVSHDWGQVETQLSSRLFTFMPLRSFCPRLQDIIDLRGLLGLRSPVHTLSRLLNPLAAPYSLQSVFHPSYSNTHQQAAAILGQPNMAVLKGDGGEFERRPTSESHIKFLRNNVCSEEKWGRLYEARQPEADTLSAERMRQLWRGSVDDHYGEITVIGTLAVILYLMNKVTSQSAAMAMAQNWWQDRDKSLI